MKKNKLGIYIHVPFCVRKCAYCDFYSLSDRSSISLYADAVVKQLGEKSGEFEAYTVDTVFFGGGTPSLLPPEEFEKIAFVIYKNFDTDSDLEFSAEVNPATVTNGHLDAFLRSGVNRVSVGMQSALDAELRTLSRIHTFDEFISTYDLIRNRGIKNINIDLMYGIPDQTIETLAETLEKTVALSPEHISAYGLKIEPDTYFGRHTDEYSFPDDDLQSDMYLYICSFLAEKGYERYEFSNFAKPGYECRHNLKYWNRDEYLGIGPAAASFIGGKRYTYTRDLDAYINNVQFKAEPELEESRYIDNEEAENERIMLGLRLTKGIVPDDGLISSSEQYIKDGYMKYNGGRLCFTEKGVLVSNYILSDLITDRKA